jgi:hypothetical protein
VDRFAASATDEGVPVGCAGGGCRRSATGLREAQPEKQTQKAQRTQTNKEAEFECRKLL